MDDLREVIARAVAEHTNVTDDGDWPIKTLSDCYSDIGPCNLLDAADAALAAIKQAGFVVVERADVQKAVCWMDDHPEAIELAEKLDAMIEASNG